MGGLSLLEINQHSKLYSLSLGNNEWLNFVINNLSFANQPDTDIPQNFPYGNSRWQSLIKYSVSSAVTGKKLQKWSMCKEWIPWRLCPQTTKLLRKLNIKQHISTNKWIMDNGQWYYMKEWVAEILKFPICLSNNKHELVRNLASW